MHSFVPAANGAVIGLTDKILTRITTKESAARGESAFLTDLKQAASILDEATPHSLVLIDEFGKGTADNDGIALFAALINWLARAAGSPRTLAITHYHEVFTKKLIAPGAAQWWSMQVLLGATGDTIECLLFKVAQEASLHSHGLHCARLAGLPEPVIDRAAELKAMFEADVPPDDLRYALVDPALEQQNTALVRRLLAI